MEMRRYRCIAAAAVLLHTGCLHVADAPLARTRVQRAWIQDDLVKAAPVVQADARVTRSNDAFVLRAATTTWMTCAQNRHEQVQTTVYHERHLNPAWPAWLGLVAGAVGVGAGVGVIATADQLPTDGSQGLSNSFTPGDAWVIGGVYLGAGAAALAFATMNWVRQFDQADAPTVAEVIQPGATKLCKQDSLVSLSYTVTLHGLQIAQGALNKKTDAAAAYEPVEFALPLDTAGALPPLMDESLVIHFEADGQPVDVAVPLSRLGAYVDAREKIRADKQAACRKVWHEVEISSDPNAIDTFSREHPDCLNREEVERVSWRLRDARKLLDQIRAMSHQDHLDPEALADALMHAEQIDLPTADDKRVVAEGRCALTAERCMRDHEADAVGVEMLGSKEARDSYPCDTWRTDIIITCLSEQYRKTAPELSREAAVQGLQRYDDLLTVARRKQAAAGVRALAQLAASYRARIDALRHQAEAERQRQAEAARKADQARDQANRRAEVNECLRASDARRKCAVKERQGGGSADLCVQGAICRCATRHNMTHEPFQGTECTPGIEQFAP